MICVSGPAGIKSSGPDGGPDGPCSRLAAAGGVVYAHVMPAITDWYSATAAGSAGVGVIPVSFSDVLSTCTGSLCGSMGVPVRQIAMTTTFDRQTEHRHQKRPIDLHAGVPKASATNAGQCPHPAPRASLIMCCPNRGFRCQADETWAIPHSMLHMPYNRECASPGTLQVIGAALHA